ncbi:MAG: sensor histidine kinase [Actinomycetota bacterium]|nr:sensor histidine kinase [Actinomycetota bacterium]
MSAASSFRHQALFYEGEDGFLAGTVPFIREGLAREEPVLAAVSADKAASISASLGPDAGRVSFLDIEDVGRNPARIIPAWRDFVDRHLPRTKSARGIGEPIWPARTPEELVECHHHESLLNLAFDGGPGWELLCPYDASRLDPEVIERAHHSHPLVSRDADLHRSEAYEPELAMNPFTGALEAPPGEAEEFVFGLEDLPELRQRVARAGAENGLEDRRRSDLVFAVSEIAANSVRHGDGLGIARVWRETGAIVCELRDQGQIRDPLAGRRRPNPIQGDGRGLWLVNQLCDLVQIRSSSSGTVVRLQMRVA